MKLTIRPYALLFLAPLFGALSYVQPSAAQAPAQYPDLPSETPAKFQPVTDSFEYVKRDLMIPMRDGVKLHTVIIFPKGAKSTPLTQKVIWGGCLAWR